MKLFKEYINEAAVQIDAHSAAKREANNQIESLEKNLNIKFNKDQYLILFNSLFDTFIKGHNTSCTNQELLIKSMQFK